MTRIRSCPTAFSASDAECRRTYAEHQDSLLLRRLEERILSGEVFAIDMYLALRTPYDVEEWAASRASVENKRRLCWWLMEGAADGQMVEDAFGGSLVYACPGMEEDFADVSV